jgi:hypothetical protein
MEKRLQNCKWCGKVRQKGNTQSWPDYLSRNFCSNKCGAKHQFQNGMSKEHKEAISKGQRGKPAWNSGTVTIKQCIQCGKDYKAPGVKKHISLYCSMKCRSDFSYQNKDKKKQRYYLEVWRITNSQSLHELPNHDKRGRIDLNENAYNLDHIIPIIYGYENNILSKEIGDIKNLQFIPAMENHKKSKGYKCQKTKEL